MPHQTAPGIRKQYLHLSLYRCENCKGPVVAASTGVRENEIAKETEIKLLGAICLSCGNRQPAEPESTCRFPPVQWETPGSVDAFDRFVRSSRSPRIKVSAKRKGRPFEEEAASLRMVDEGCPNTRTVLNATGIARGELPGMTPLSGSQEAGFAPILP